MTTAQFRKLALALPEATPGAHGGHEDFRVAGKVFATLGYPDDAWGMLKLTPEQQAALVEDEPKIFVPVKGAWGRRGCTNFRVKAATKAKLLGPLLAAWRNVAPRKIAAQFEG